MITPRLCLLLMDAFFSKEKFNYSWVIPVVDYFSHALVINRKIILCKCQKLCVQCRNTYLICVDLIELFTFVLPNTVSTLKSKQEAWFYYYNLTTISHMLIQIPENNSNCFGLVNLKKIVWASSRYFESPRSVELLELFFCTASFGKENFVFLILLSQLLLSCSFRLKAVCDLFFNVCL